MSVTLESSLPQLAAQLRERAGQHVRTTIMNIQADAQANAPVDEGTLRNSGSSEMTDDLSGVVGYGAEHAIHQEYGTGVMAAQPSLYPAMESNREEFKQGLKELVK